MATMSCMRARSYPVIPETTKIGFFVPLVCSRLSIWNIFLCNLNWSVSLFDKGTNWSTTLWHCQGHTQIQLKRGRLLEGVPCIRKAGLRIQHLHFTLHACKSQKFVACICHNSFFHCTHEFGKNFVHIRSWHDPRELVLQNHTKNTLWVSEIGTRGVKLENLWNVGEFVSMKVVECVLRVSNVLKVGQFADFTHHVCGNGFSIYAFIEEISPLSLMFFFPFWIHTPSAPSTARASTDGGAAIRKTWKRLTRRHSRNGP